MYITEDWELRQRQSLPLEAKIVLSQRRIREWYEHWDGQVYVSFSGGKDSTVLLDLVRQLYPDVPGVFVDTGLEYPEIRRFVKSKENIVKLKPKMNFHQVISTYGNPVISKRQAQYIREIQKVTGKNEATIRLRLTGIRSSGKYSGYSKISEKWKFLKDAPFKISEKCCAVMKKQPLHVFAKDTGRQPFVGTMASDGANRELEYIRTGCNAFGLGYPKSAPLGFWTEQDVLQYLIDFKKPYSSVYGDIISTKDGLVTTGASRTGCMFCMFGVHLEKGENRFQRMERTHPKYWKYCIKGGRWKNGKWVPYKGLGLGYVLRTIGVDYRSNSLFPN